MLERIEINQVPDLFDSIAAQFQKNEGMLGEMDALLGDGDLGLTMRKGFSALPGFMRATQEHNISMLLRKAGMEMMDVVPSTMGMLMGTGLSFAGKALIGCVCIDARGLSLFLRGYADGIVRRGRCSRGDRTVLDSIGLAADYANKALTDGNGAATLKEICQAALTGANEGAESTRIMTPKFGKAAVHVDAARGVIDQGAMAGLLLVQGITEYAMKQ